MFNPKHIIYLIIFICLSCSINLQYDTVTKRIVNGNTSAENLTILGTIHHPTGNINADSIYQYIENIKPSVILIESDMSNFHPDFSIRKSYDENEWNAVLRYKQENPDIEIRPFDFEGRNQFKKDNGINFSDLVFEQVIGMDSLDQLTYTHSEVLQDFLKQVHSLNENSYGTLNDINNILVDSLVKERQNYQYQKLGQIITSYPIFDQMSVLSHQQDTLSYNDIYFRFRDFELLREQTMVENIEKWMRQFPKSRTLVLTGFYHAYYLREQLK